jgi:glycosyltransferase involved in cell wall biosynthesis
MKVTVIVCTYNRCDTLATTLESLAASTVPDSVEWKIAVIDNNSSDRTRQVVEDFSRRFPGRFRYAFEPRQGKPFALNRGVREAQADVLAFTDDDVIAEPAWLWNLTRNLFSGEWQGAGGKILPLNTAPIPDWIPRDTYGVLWGSFDLGDECCDITRVAPYGANMAFRSDVFDHGLFRTDIGPGVQGSRSTNCEDQNIGEGVLRRGGKLRYEPEAVIHHPFDTRRISRKYISNVFFQMGRYRALETESKPTIYGVPRRYFAIVKLLGFECPQRVYHWLSTFEPAQRFTWRILISSSLGQAYELAFGHRASTAESAPTAPQDS